MERLSRKKIPNYLELMVQDEQSHCDCKKRLVDFTFLVDHARSTYERVPSYWARAIQGGVDVAELAVSNMEYICADLKTSPLSKCICKYYLKLEKIEGVVKEYWDNLKRNEDLKESIKKHKDLYEQALSEEDEWLKAVKRCSFTQIAIIIEEPLEWILKMNKRGKKS